MKDVDLHLGAAKVRAYIEVDVGKKNFTGLLLLCNFVYKYRNACWDNPDAELRISI